MKTVEKEVRSQSNTVGTAKYNVYDSLDEAISDIGDSVALTLINIQTKTNAMNSIRQAATGKLTKSAAQRKAMGLITQEEFAECMGDATKLENLLAQKVEIVLAEKADAKSLLNADDEPEVVNEIGPEDED